MSSTVSPSESIGLLRYHVVVAVLSDGVPILTLIATSTLSLNLLRVHGIDTVSTYSPCKTFLNLTGSSGMTQLELKLHIPTRLAYPFGSDKLRTEPVAETIRIIMKS
jgi:hypothetical protein